MELGKVLKHLPLPALPLNLGQTAQQEPRREVPDAEQQSRSGIGPL